MTGAPMGAIIVGDSRFVAQARRIRKSVGGGMRQAGVLTAAARVAVNDMFLGDLPASNGAKLREVHRVALQVAKLWLRMGGRLLRRSETNLVWVNLRDIGLSDEDFRDIGTRYGVKIDGCRIVLHHQISREGLRRLELTFGAALNSVNKSGMETQR